MQELKWNKPTNKLMPKISVSVDKNSPENTITVITIDQSILDPVYYFDVFHRLNTAKPGDTIHIMINTPGGDARTCIELVNLMQVCKAKIVTTVTGWAYSCGAYIWSFGHERRMGKFTKIMWHTSSHMDMEKTRTVIDNAVIIEKSVEQMFDKIVAKGILTPADKEFCFVQRKDLYYFYNDMKNRGVLTNAQP